METTDRLAAVGELVDRQTVKRWLRMSKSELCAECGRRVVEATGRPSKDELDALKNAAYGVLEGHHVPYLKTLYQKLVSSR